MTLMMLGILWLRRSHIKHGKKMATYQTESKYAYLSISKEKVKQFQRQPKEIQESDENLKKGR